MKNNITASLAVAVTLFAASAFAQDVMPGAGAPTGAAPPDQGTEMPAPTKHKAHGHRHRGSGSSRNYEQCLKENLAVAEYYCNSHPDACDTEKAGAKSECREEARGVKHRE